MTEGVHVEDRGATRWITLDRPETRNALEPGVLVAMTEAVKGAASARVIVLRGAGGAFCSGADLRHAMGNAAELMADLEGHLGRFQDLVRVILAAPQPVIAAVDGAAYGFGQKWSQTVVFTILILVMVFRPTGILGQPTVEKV